MTGLCDNSIASKCETGRSSLTRVGELLLTGWDDDNWGTGDNCAKVVAVIHKAVCGAEDGL